MVSILDGKVWNSLVCPKWKMEITEMHSNNFEKTYQ